MQAQVNGEVGRTVYSQLMVVANQTATAATPTPSLPPKDQEEADLGVKTIKPAVIKPAIKKRKNIPKTTEKTLKEIPEKPSEKPQEKTLTKIPSYSTVSKPKAPPIPPRVEGGGVEGGAGYYKVPSNRPKYDIEDNRALYDRPSSVVRVARSCEDIARQLPYQQPTPDPCNNISSSRGCLDPNSAIYDRPPNSSRQVASQMCLVWKEDGARSASSNNMAAAGTQSSVASLDSYIDMTGSFV